MSKISQIFKVALGIGLCLQFWACANFREEILYRSADLGDYDSAAVGTGLELDPDHYKAALTRWPWASGAQLRRRALILALHPSAEQLELLDRSGTSTDELEVLNRLSTLHVAHLPN